MIDYSGELIAIAIGVAILAVSSGWMVMELMAIRATLEKRK